MIFLKTHHIPSRLVLAAAHQVELCDQRLLHLVGVVDEISLFCRTLHFPPPDVEGGLESAERRAARNQCISLS